MESIFNLGFSQLKAKYISGELKPTEVIKAYLEQLHKTADLNHTITFCDDEALAAAAEADKRYKDGNPRFLEGMPMTVKDLFCTKGIKTTAASNMLKDFVPDYESFVSEKALAAGAIMLGKANMDEFAMGGANKYSAFGQAYNPISPSCSSSRACDKPEDSCKNTCKKSCSSNKGELYVTGGSSGGSAAAVAAKGCLFSLGSDTGGSVRQPAAFCGVVGLRPTYGRCSRRGMIAFCSSLDQAGVLGKDVSTTAALAQAVMGYDQYDCTSVDLPVPDLVKCRGDIKNLKIGVLTDQYITDPSIKARYESLQALFKKNGCTVEPVELKYLEHALSVYYIIAPVEAMSNMARYDGVRYGTRGTGETYHEQCKDARKNFGEEVKRRILLGTYLSSQEHYGEYFEKAQKVRQALRSECMNLYKQYDLLIGPTTPHTAFPISTEKSPVELYYEDYYVSFINLVGCCGISVPVGTSDTTGMPIGMQLIGKPFDEELLIEAALFVEKNIK